jgi:hypothetical protein
VARSILPDTRASRNPDPALLQRRHDALLSAGIDNRHLDAESPGRPPLMIPPVERKAAPTLAKEGSIVITRSRSAAAAVGAALNFTAASSGAGRCQR